MDNGWVSPAAPFEIVRRRPAPQLAGLVAGIVGLSERSSTSVTRRQPAGTLIPLVISFGSPLRVKALSDGEGADRSYGSFVAGLSQGHASTQHPGDQDCVQVYLTPVGVRRVLGLPGSELARRVVPVEEIADDLGPDLAARIAETPAWADRLDQVEGALICRTEQAAAPPDWIEGMWHELAASAGRTPIGELVARTGWSHRYVATRFREEIGLTPKEVAGIFRFERAVAALGTTPLADLAAQCGYADQSHLSRDVVRHAGEPPAALAAARRPTAYTALGELVGGHSRVAG